MQFAHSLCIAPLVMVVTLWPIPTAAECMVTAKTDPLTDATITVASCAADEHDSPSGAPILVFRCSQARYEQISAEISVNWGEFLHTEALMVGMRIGEATHTDLTWRTSTDYRSAFLPGGTSAALACAQAVKGQRIVSRVVPHGENPRTAVWHPLDEDAIQTALASCASSAPVFAADCPVLEADDAHALASSEEPNVRIHRADRAIRRIEIADSAGALIQGSSSDLVGRFPPGVYTVTIKVAGRDPVSADFSLEDEAVDLRCAPDDRMVKVICMGPEARAELVLE
jgi:hypothetical protein